MTGSVPERDITAQVQLMTGHDREAAAPRLSCLPALNSTPLRRPSNARRSGRRTFLRYSVGLSGAALGMLSSACRLLPSQGAPRMPRVGYLSVGPRASQADFIDAFLDGLHSRGYVDGQTISIDWRLTDPHGQGDQFQVLAAELAREPVDLVVAGASTPAAQAARQATTTIPILAVAVRDPVATGLVASLAHPGGNVTALSTGVDGFGRKSVEMLRQVVPALAHVAVLVDATNLAMVQQWEDSRVGAEQAGIVATRIDIQSVDDLDAAFEAAASQHVDAVIVAANPLLLPVSDHLAELALRYRLPGYGLKQYVQAGLLMTYNADLAAVHRRAALYVERILNGEKPADLPVEQPTTFELVVNARTAAALGLTIDPVVAAQVTQWVR